ncbi:MAG: amidohydrolase/deacetylase family metallohydrolase, partial [Betaproteobacteria bacterium AqS2]|nr:amidohydrolase/deacetylase family metallohydrolase [Betaproteobacteria bacterium AqS2]
IHVGADGLVKAEPEAGAKDIDCGGAWLSPGWTDLHVHVWHGGTDISVRAADVGRATGVTAFVDAGSAGEGSFAGLREYVLDRCEETVRAFVNISSIGLVCCNRIPELLDARFIDVGRTMAVIEANRDVVCGVKIRASGVIVGSWGAGPVRIAKRVAQMAGLPLMAHIGEPPPVPDEVLDVLEPGDVVTHCFNGKPGGSLTDAPAVFALAKEAAARGILMDVGHGAASFDFDAARRAIDGGLRPYSISTDLHRENIDGPVHDMATTMAKLHAVGLDFEECVAAAAARPRDFLGLEAGAAPGARADYTVFDCVDCDLEVRDSMGKKLRLRRMFEPRVPN